MSFFQILIGETKGELIARGTAVAGTAGWLDKLPDGVPQIVYLVVALAGAVATVWMFVLNRREKLLKIELLNGQIEKARKKKNR